MRFTEEEYKQFVKDVIIALIHCCDPDEEPQHLVESALDIAYLTGKRLEEIATPIPRERRKGATPPGTNNGDDEEGGGSRA